MKTEGEYLNPEQNKKTNSFEGRLRTSIRTASEIHLGLLSKTLAPEQIKKIYTTCNKYFTQKKNIYYKPKVSA